MNALGLKCFIDSLKDQSVPVFVTLATWNFKRDVMTPLDFADKMSSNILKVVQTQYS